MSQRSKKTRKIKIICEEEETENQSTLTVMTRPNRKKFKRQTRCSCLECSSALQNAASSTSKEQKIKKEALSKTASGKSTTPITKIGPSLDVANFKQQKSVFALANYQNSHPSTSSRHYSNDVERSFSGDDIQLLVTTKLSSQSSIIDEVDVTAFSHGNQPNDPSDVGAGANIKSLAGSAERTLTTLEEPTTEDTPQTPERSVRQRLDSVRRREKKASTFKEYSELIVDYLQKDLPKKKGHFHGYQIQAVLNAKELISQDEISGSLEVKPVLIVAPTGSGKSGMIVLLPYVLISRKVLIITPSNVISKQIGRAFGVRPDQQCFFDDIGLLDEYSKNERVMVLDDLMEHCSVIRRSEEIKERLGGVVVVNAQKFGGTSNQSLTYNGEDITTEIHVSFFSRFDTLIVDEAHHYPAETWVKIIDKFVEWGIDGVSKKIIFLTATPYRHFCGQNIFILGNGKEAQKRIAYNITKEMIKGVTIRTCEFWEPNYNYDENVSIVYKDLKRLFAANTDREPRFTPQAMILVNLTKKATFIAAELNKLSGDPNYAVAIRPKSPELEQFSNGFFKVAVTCGVALEGYDNPNIIVCVILKKIRKGRILFDQFVGRCMRLKRGLKGPKPDQSIGTVLSYPDIGQKKLWDEMERVVAEEDPGPTENDDDIEC